MPRGSCSRPPRPEVRACAPLLIPVILLSGCLQWGVKRDLAPPPLTNFPKPEVSSRRITGSYQGDRPAPAAFLMAHMENGDVCVFDEWKSAVSVRGRISGRGRVRDASRRLIRDGELSIPIDSVALFETNSMVNRLHPAVVVGGVVAAAVLIGVAVSGDEPEPPPPQPTLEKSPMGSCPTFYHADGDRPLLRAEGFSASVARSLEARDVDALPGVRPSGGEIEIVMKNEALETHVVRYVHLLATPRPPGGRVFVSTAGDFWQSSRVLEPSLAEAPEGDCLSKLLALDGDERFSPADSSDLAARETIEVEFADVSEGRWGLVVAARQSLLGTFLFYRALAYLGRSAGHWLAMVERDDPCARAASQAIWKRLGGIEVSMQGPDGAWATVGEIDETGPLATDVHLLPLPGAGSRPARLRLRLARGFWRLDQLALARLDRPVEPVRIAPASVRHGSALDETAREALSDTAETLVTLPGDEYAITYTIPPGAGELELFLESRGYYYEWIREEWLADENPARATIMLWNPDQALRDMAPEFKRHEAEWEARFWGSRYARR